MAQGKRLVCSKCRQAVEAWDEGNPYYRSVNGRKHYAYHPSAERELCVGNDEPHLCLDCGRAFNVDSRAPRSGCPKCRGTNIIGTWRLEGHRCPYCQVGVFDVDPDGYIIS